MKLLNGKDSSKLFKLPLNSLLSLSKQGTPSLDHLSFEEQQLFGGLFAEAGVWQQIAYLATVSVKLRLLTERE